MQKCSNVSQYHGTMYEGVATKSVMDCGSDKCTFSIADIACNVSLKYDYKARCL